MTDKVKDPVCGMEIRPEEAAVTAEHEGRTFFFCSHGCHAAYLKEPHRYSHPAEEQGDPGQHARH